MASPPESRRAERERRGETLDLLLRVERGRLMRQAHFHSYRHEDADDALNDACIQFLRFYDGPPGDDALRWMLVVVKRCAWAIRRQTVKRETRYLRSARDREDELLEAIIPDRRYGTAELVERAEDTAEILALIDELKPDERTALILLGLGCSYEEICELRGWTRTKVNRCLAEGRARVRELLERGET